MGFRAEPLAVCSSDRLLFTGMCGDDVGMAPLPSGFAVALSGRTRLQQSSNRQQSTDEPAVKLLYSLLEREEEEGLKLACVLTPWCTDVPRE